MICVKSGDPFLQVFCACSLIVISLPWERTPIRVFGVGLELLSALRATISLCSSWISFLVVSDISKGCLVSLYVRSLLPWSVLLLSLLAFAWTFVLLLVLNKEFHGFVNSCLGLCCWFSLLPALVACFVLVDALACVAEFACCVGVEW